MIPDRTLVAEARDFVRARTDVSADALALIAALAARIESMDTADDRYRKHGGECRHRYVREDNGKCLECDQCVHRTVNPLTGACVHCGADMRSRA